MTRPKARKSFKVLIDNSNEAYQAIEEMADANDNFVASLTYMSRADAIEELWASLQMISKNPELSEKAKLSQVIQHLHEIANTYAQFFDKISEDHPEIIEGFFEEQSTTRETKH